MNVLYSFRPPSAPKKKKEKKEKEKEEKKKKNGDCFKVLYSVKQHK